MPRQKKFLYILIQGQLALNRPRTQPSQAEQMPIPDLLAPAKEILIQGQLAPNRPRTQPSQAKQILIQDPLAPAKEILIQGQLAPNRLRTQPAQTKEILIQDPLAPAKEILIYSYPGPACPEPPANPALRKNNQLKGKSISFGQANLKEI